MSHGDYQTHYPKGGDDPYESIAGPNDFMCRCAKFTTDWDKVTCPDCKEHRPVETTKTVETTKKFEAAKVAADWWYNVLHNPKFDNGDGFQSAFADVMYIASQPRMQQAITPERLAAFRDNLEETLNTILAKNDKFYPGNVQYAFILRVDYHADRDLYNAAVKAGIPEHTAGGILMWPCKTTMRIKTNEVAVRYGYGAEEQVIWNG